MKTVSWILLAVLGVLILLGGLASMAVAYFADTTNDVIVGSISLQSLNQSEEVVSALRGRRGTAAAFSLGFATLLLFTVVGPYRRGEVWAWWAILCSVVVLAAVILMRIPLLGVSQGSSTGGVLLIFVGVALLLDIRRLSR